MRSTITPVLLLGALAFAGAASAAVETEVTVIEPDRPALDYKAEYAKCARLPGSDQIVCRDVVGMRESEVDRTGVPSEEIGSLQSGERCALLNADARRDCQLSDKAG